MKKSLFLALTVLVALFFSACGGKNLDLLEHANVEFSGINTQGTVSVKMNESAEDTLFAAAGYKDGDDPLAYLDLALSINTQVSPKDGLSNGDTVTVKLVYDSAVLEKYKIKLGDTEKTVEVAGLTDAEVIDVFKDVELVYEEASPFLKVSIANRSQDEFIKTVRFSTENINNVAIGDSVTVTAAYDQNTAVDKGIIVESTEKVFKVEKTAKYVSSFDEIDEPSMEKIVSEATDKITSELARNSGTMLYMSTGDMSYTLRSESNEVGKPVPVGIYLLSLKNGETLPYDYKGAFVAVIFSVSVKNGDKSSTGYFDVIIPNLTISEDGTFNAIYSSKSMLNSFGGESEEAVYEKSIAPFISAFIIERKELVPATTAEVEKVTDEVLEGIPDEPIEEDTVE